MSRPTTTRIALAGVLLSATAGCRPPELPALLVPAPEAVVAPTVTRIPLALDEEQLRMYELREASIVGLWKWRREETAVVSFAGTMTPLESFVYDTSRDRFIVPGFWALSRAGELTFDPPPLAAPAGVSQQSNAELRREVDYSGCEGIIAVRYEMDTITVLCADTSSTRGHHGRRYPDVLNLGRIDARSLELVEWLALPPAPGWNSWSTLEHFLESGDVVIGIEASARQRRWMTIPRTQGRRRATVRIDPSGEVDVISRGQWYSAGVTRQGEVVGVTSRGRRAALLWLDRDGAQRARIPLDYAGSTATYADGVCTLEQVERKIGGTFTCFDRDGRLLWRRFTHGWIISWVVDDEGWSYFLGQYEQDPVYTLVAVGPDGMIAWRVPMGPLVGTLLVAGDDLCFVAEHSPDSELLAPELVCVGPRHGPLRTEEEARVQLDATYRMNIHE